jgi:hypothetical protein
VWHIGVRENRIHRFVHRSLSVADRHVKFAREFLDDRTIPGSAAFSGSINVGHTLVPVLQPACEPKRELTTAGAKEVTELPRTVLDMPSGTIQIDVGDSWLFDLRACHASTSSPKLKEKEKSAGNVTCRPKDVLPIGGRGQQHGGTEWTHTVGSMKRRGFGRRPPIASVCTVRKPHRSAWSSLISATL